MKSLVFTIGSLMAVSAFSMTLNVEATHFSASYKGLPFHDSRYHGGAQSIPGRVECAYYDLGGEGVAYHDSTEKNEGSGGLNPADGSYLNEFRMHEGVDTSYTKFHDGIDNNPYDIVTPEENQLYVGWTTPGEWFNITVDVAHAGTYSADLLYTSNRGGTISVDINGEPATGPLAITTTFNAADPIAWRQWHHWNVMKGLVKLKLAAGKNVLTIHILTQGNMNLAYFQFNEA
jgi:carbohydrate binding protein with CBM6 domain